MRVIDAQTSAAKHKTVIGLWGEVSAAVRFSAFPAYELELRLNVSANAHPVVAFVDGKHPLAHLVGCIHQVHQEALRKCL